MNMIQNVLKYLFFAYSLVFFQDLYVFLHPMLLLEM